MRNAIAFAVTVLLFPSLFGQFSERIDVRVHELEVVVERRDGKPVIDLQKDDFIVLQEGVPQTITNFYVVRESGAAAAVSAPAAPAATNTAPAAEAPPKRKPRKFIFFVDEFGMHDAARKELLDRCRELVGAMHDGDEAMVITPASKQRIALFFTPDTQALMNTLERVTGAMMRKGAVRRLDSMPLASESPAEDSAVRGIAIPVPGAEPPDPLMQRGDCGQSARKCAEQRLTDLRSIVRALSEVPGKKVLVLLTRTMTSVPGLELHDPGQSRGAESDRNRPGIVADFSNLGWLIDEVARAAAASNVMIYGLEAYEPGEQGLAGVTVETGRDTLSTKLRPQTANAELRRTTQRGAEGVQDLLQTLAEATGAKSFSGTRETGEMFERISQDLSVYYSIGYRDEDTKKKEHSVRVRIRNHPEYVVRARRTVRTITPEDEERGRAMAAVLSSSSANSLRVRLTASPLVRKGRTVDIPVHVHVPLSRLTFLEQGNDLHAQFRVLVAAVGEHADFGSSSVEHTQDVVVPRSRWDSAQAQEFRYDTTVRMRPGKYRVAVGVTDTSSGESGFQTFTVDAK